MRTMRLLQGGVPKCGNFWLYQIIQNIFRAAGREPVSHIERHPIYPIAQTWDLNFPGQERIDVLEITDLQYAYRISSVFKMPIDDIQNYVAQTEHVWTHSPVCKKSGEVFKLFDKKVYIIRDPRDRALSAARYYCSEYMLKYFPQEEKDPEMFLQKNLEQLMGEWVWHVWDHLRLSHEFNIHIVFYENFLDDFQKELSGLLEYLEVELSSAQRQRLEAELRFSRQKKKNPKHLIKGTAGYWKKKLTEPQIQKTRAIAGPLMRFLNYSDEETSLPYFSASGPAVFEQLKQDIIDAQQSL